MVNGKDHFYDMLKKVKSVVGWDIARQSRYILDKKLISSIYKELQINKKKNNLIEKNREKAFHRRGNPTEQ